MSANFCGKAGERFWSKEVSSKLSRVIRQKGKSALAVGSESQTSANVFARQIGKIF
jgi:hypothetical protein